MERDMLYKEVKEFGSFLHEFGIYGQENEIASTSVNHTEGFGFYSQMNNANILHGNGNLAKMRTCNITCIAMVLESMGLKPTDTKPEINRTVLAKVSSKYSKELGGKDLYALRFPDFLQILSIYLKLKKTGNFESTHFDNARTLAAGSITAWSFMDELAESFDNVTFESASLFGKTINDGLKALGKKLRKNSVTDAEANNVIGLSAYRNKVLETVTKDVQNGSKIIIHEYNHFTVLLSLDSSEIHHHNPGQTKGGNMVKSWNEARKKGMFSGYMRVSSGKLSGQIHTTSPAVPTSNPISSAIQAAVRYNVANATTWQPRADRIYRQLGFPNTTPNPETFAEALMKWQSQNGLSSDGKLGSQSLAKFVSGSSLKGSLQPSASTTGNAMNLKIESNRKYAISLGWNQYLDAINDVLLPYSGQSNVSLSEADFSSALIKWQSANGLLNDGVLGPRTWLKMQSQLKSGQPPRSSNTIPITTIIPGAHSAIPPLGRLQVNTNVVALKKAISSYQFTSDDALWLARFVKGEAGGKNTPENHAVIYAVFNRYGAFRHLPAANGWGSFGSFIRKYSTTLQAMLNSVGAARRVWQNHKDHPEKYPVEPGVGFYKGTNVQKVQYKKHITLQQKPWGSFSSEVQNLVVNMLTGKIPNPGIGMASEFASTNVYFKDHYKRYPNDTEWVSYTLKFAKDKKWIWVGQIAGINQKKNAFFIDQRLKEVPLNSISVV